MEFFGIKFAPLNTPMRRRLQTLAAGAWFHIMALGGLIGFASAMYLLFFTKYWLGTFVYLTWLYTIDGDVCERGARPIKWVRNLTWWRYMKEYFPFELKKQPGVELDPKKNYLFCSFPHGMLATGAFLSFGTDVGGFNNLFPKHASHLITLKQNLMKPYMREFLLSLGICSSSRESLAWLLKYPFGGKVAVLVVGGAAEALYSRPGKYEVVLKHRKGFVREAIKNGSPLVPVLSFGETALFDQFDNPEGSKLRKVQEWVKSICQISPIIPIGRGFLQYSFGWVPHRLPITTIVGKPLDVQQNDNPSSEEIDSVHGEFVKHLTEFFEEEKHKYIKDAEKTELIIN